MRRHCSFDPADVVGRQNGPDEANPMEEYLVYGHFDERDVRQTGVGRESYCR